MPRRRRNLISVKVAIAAVLAVILVAASAVLDVLTTPRQPGVAVLVYHQVVTGATRVPMQLSANLFQRQMAYLRRRGFHFASTAELDAYLSGSLRLPPRTVMVTFDDGYADNYWVAYPLLKQYGARATIFSIASMIGSKDHLTPEQMDEMQASGLVEFQNHTNALHFRLINGSSALLAMPPEMVRDDLLTARSTLHSFLGTDPEVFAYPYGAYNQGLDRPLADSGQNMAFTIEKGYVRPGGDRYRLPRLHVPNQPALFLKFMSIVEGRAVLQ